MSRTTFTRSLDTLLAHGDFVRALAQALVFDSTLADDVAQEAWLMAIEHPPRSPAAGRNWLARVTRSAASKMLIGMSRRRAREHAAARREAIPSADEVIEREATRRRVVEAVLALEEPYRAVVLLRFFDGLPPREIARRLGVPVETARTRLKRALDRLRAKLDAEEGGDRHSWCLLLAPLALVRKPSRAGGLAAPFLGAALVKSVSKFAVLAVLLVATYVAYRSLAPWKTPTADSNTDVAGVSAPHAAEREPSEGATTSPARVTADSSVSRVTGVVVDSRGNPISAARVVSFPEDEPEPIRLAEAGTGRGSARLALSDDRGRFVVALAERAPFFGLLVEATGFSPAGVESIRAGADVVVTLDTPRALAGTVMDIEAKPVSGARVRWRGMMSLAVLEREAVSHDDGSYRIDAIPSPGTGSGESREESWQVEVLADGFAPLLIRPLWTPVQAASSGDLLLELVLVRGARVTGRVIDADSGEPLAGARVTLRSREGSVRLAAPDDTRIRVWSEERPLDEAVTGDDGAFVFPHVPATGFHDVLATHFGSRERYLGIAWVARTGYALAGAMIPVRRDGSSVDLEIRCWPACRIQGRVVDGAGVPVFGAEVWASSYRQPIGSVPGGPASPSRLIVRTDASGQYVLEAVPASRLGPTPTAIQARVFGIQSFPAAALDALPRPGETLEMLDLVVERDPSASIVVVNGDGEPVWGAVVQEPGGAIDVARRTDKFGRLEFPFRRESSDEPRRLLVEARGYSAALTAEFTPTLVSPPELRVVLEEEHVLGGIVRFDDGMPAFARIAVAVGPVPLDQAFLNVNGRADPASLRRAYAESRDDGAFEVRALPSGPVHARVEAWRPGPRRLESPPIVKVFENLATDSRDLMLTMPAPPPEPLAVVVVGCARDAVSGSPIVRPEVRLERERERVSARLVAPGRFRFDAAPVGTWTLSVTAAGYLPFKVPKVEITSEGVTAPIEVALDRGASVRGVIRGPDDLDLDAMFLSFLRDDESPRQHCRVEKDGSFRMTGLEPGRYRPCVEFPDSFAGGEMVAVHPFSELIVPGALGEIAFDFSIVWAGKLEIRVTCPRLLLGEPGKTATDEHHRGIPGSRLEILDRDGNRVAERRVPSPSVTALFLLAPGDYRVTVEIPGAPPKKSTVTIEAGEAQSLSFELP